MLDTDFAIKLEKIQKINAIEQYIPKLVGKLSIHQYIYDNEILTPKRIKEQLNNLISQNKAVIVNTVFLKDDPIKTKIYRDTINHIENVDQETRINGKNWGETVTLAYAFTQGISVVLSDETDLQAMIDNELNSGDENDIKVIRLRDFILGMKQLELSRKDAYQIWCLSHKKGLLDWAKRTFQEDLWPLNKKN
ncbi:hypothetical protein [Aquibacillus kalidii]|uniref:hypothetical protein n=1 Tax=Aquibacillus kalidii TaxID=2762597 RepID=UPI0016461642|nr:hypothetical protein [Aquibacillus kalidii]